MDPEIHFLPTQEVDLRDFKVEGLALDLGGGGEGVIGQIGGHSVVAIDTRLDELAETSNLALKIRMDARDLQFLPGTFDAVTSFYTMMYVHRDDRGQVLAEAFRVLKPGGRMYLWEPIIPARDGGPEVIAVGVTVLLPGGVSVNTGYGVPWAGHEQDSEYYLALADAAGFIAVDSTAGDGALQLVLTRP